jgi:hypothetical protein
LLVVQTTSSPVAADMGMSLLVTLNAMRPHGRSTPNTGTIPAGPVDPCTKKPM